MKEKERIGVSQSPKKERIMMACKGNSVLTVPSCRTPDMTSKHKPLTLLSYFQTQGNKDVRFGEQKVW
jgi:hypothetical protein